LRLLARAEIIRPAEGDRFYLSESALENSPLKKLAGIKSATPSATGPGSE
jgi:hypothetical protein